MLCAEPYLGVGDVDLKQSRFGAEGAETDDVAAGQRDGGVVQQAAVDVRAVFRAEISQRETATLAVVLDKRVLVIHRLSLRCDVKSLSRRHLCQRWTLFV